MIWWLYLYPMLALFVVHLFPTLWACLLAPNCYFTSNYLQVLLLILLVLVIITFNTSAKPSQAGFSTTKIYG